MKFWRMLRWVASALFICVLLFAWLASDGTPGANREALHPAPVFVH